MSPTFHNTVCFPFVPYFFSQVTFAREELLAKNYHITPNHSLDNKRVALQKSTDMTLTQTAPNESTKR